MHQASLITKNLQSRLGYHLLNMVEIQSSFALRIEASQREREENIEWARKEARLVTDKERITIEAMTFSQLRGSCSIYNSRTNMSVSQMLCSREKSLQKLWSESTSDSQFRPTREQIVSPISSRYHLCTAAAINALFRSHWGMLERWTKDPRILPTRNHISSVCPSVSKIRVR